MLGHDGGTLGYISRMRYFPETDTTVVVLTTERSNSVVSSIDSIFSAVSNTLFPDSENIITSKELVDSLDDNFVDSLINVIDGIKNEADLVNLLSDEKALANIQDNVNLEKYSQLVLNPNNAVSSKLLLDFISFGGIVPEESNKMVGNGADNTLVGENRDDNLSGGAGNDLIFGQGGNDTISGGLGNDTLYGGALKDVFILEENAGTDTIVDFKIGEDLIDVTDFNLDLDSDLDKVNFTQQGKDALISFNGQEILNLQGVDIENLNEDSFIIKDISPNPEPLFGTVNDDVIEIELDNQLVFAGKGDDLIDASNSSKNRIYAGNDDDTLILGQNSRLFGDAGNDRFFSTSGGNNIISGGAGADQFWIAVASTPDTANTITDFTNGEDVIGIAGLGIGFADIDIAQQDDNSLISLNGGNIAILQGINADSLSLDNFTFAG